MDSAPDPISTDHVFEDLTAYTTFNRARENFSNILVPGPLHLTIPPPPIFNFKSTDIWLREDLALALRAEEKPGMQCPGPLFEVFGP